MPEGYSFNSFDELFEKVKKHCLDSGAVQETAYKLWIVPLEARDFDGKQVTLFFATDFQKNTFVSNYEATFKKAFLEVTGIEPDIVITTQDPQNTVTKFDTQQYDIISKQLEEKLEGAEYDYTFDTFIVGSSNQFAYAACTAVAKGNSDNNGRTYNPLFIYGPSGLGKTHLLTAISNEMKSRKPDINIIYVTGETFSNELIEAIKMKKETTTFHEKYRKADVLLVDDVQFIAGKESTQEEFFHTFNELHKDGRQIVLTSDKPPKDIKTLEDRIRNRFEWGLIADISTPDFETRIAIIRRKAELLDLNLPDEVSEFIANRLKTNIRQLEGAVKKLKALKHLAGSPPTIAMAQSVIRDILNDDQPIPITVEKIIGEVANVYGVTPDDIRSQKRSSQISNARKVAIYVVREITQMSLVSIGTEFGGRDHSTIVYAINSVEHNLKTDSSLREMVDDIIKNIRDKGK
ncbi:MAG: chromosomal replication initiator protein DnaA [Oscillospiraceae bacterium]|nr:chromosomal replication initiator protein DnaA [Oscillospiraceae bacterium]MBP1591286.1 chromosomal replication initiator protein DnaA [Oscillospiraceae bacterium]